MPGPNSFRTQPREADGKFGEKTGAPSEVALVDAERPPLGPRDDFVGGRRAAVYANAATTQGLHSAGNYNRVERTGNEALFLLNGDLHREDGPAQVIFHGEAIVERHYFLHGEEITAFDDGASAGVERAVYDMEEEFGLLENVPPTDATDKLSDAISVTATATAARIRYNDAIARLKADRDGSGDMAVLEAQRVLREEVYDDGQGFETREVSIDVGTLRALLAKAVPQSA